METLNTDYTPIKTIREKLTILLEGLTLYDRNGYNYHMLDDQHIYRCPSVGLVSAPSLVNWNEIEQPLYSTPNIRRINGRDITIPIGSIDDISDGQTVYIVSLSAPAKYTAACVNKSQLSSELTIGLDRKIVHLFPGHAIDHADVMLALLN